MKKIILLVAVLAAVLVVPSVSSASGRQAVTASPPAQSAIYVHDCATATQNANYGLRRYKKVYKKWRNGRATTRHMKWARRIWKQELRVKERYCSGGGGGGTVTDPQPLALTSNEVYNRVLAVAYQEYLADDNAYDYGAADTSTCASKATYRWSCYGWNDELNGDRCWFREVVERSGYNGIVSHRDTSYGWVCV